MGKLRFFIALWASKLARIAIKLLGRNASHWPGKIAIKLCPDFLGRCGRPKTVVGVTGTNGKTTCCNMLIDFFQENGETVLSNRLGSNTNAGLASAMSLGNTIFGKSRYSVAVLEIDERSSKLVYPYIKPDYIIVTNLFRDSIRRNAHAEFIADILDESLPASSELVLNGDDLISCRLAPENKRVYFGIGQLPTDVTECENIINDIRICPVCHTKLMHKYLRYHHIGSSYCPACGFSSPELDYIADEVDFENCTMHIKESGGSESYRLPVNSVFNIYNVVAVIALLREMGYSHQVIKRSIDRIHLVETRYSTDTKGDISIVTHLAKGQNPVACSLVFDWVRKQPGKKEIILVLSADIHAHDWPENITWLYDCDFEFMNSPDITRIVIGGWRAPDYKLRLMIAGVPEEKIVCCSTEIGTADMLELEPGETVYVLHDILHELYSHNLAFDIRSRIEARVAEKEGLAE